MLWRKLQLNWRYAIGEFVIVLFGVLAALAVDNWNSGRQDQILEGEYVNALLADLRDDEIAINSAMEGAETFATRGRILLAAIDSGELTVDPREFVVAATTAAYLRFPTFTRATINDLMSTGNLRLIRDGSVRKMISAYYTEVDNRGQWNQNWRDYQVHLGKMIPEVVPLKFRDAYEFQSAGGPPWAENEIIASAADANAILQRLVAHPTIRPAIENMVRTQGVHYTYHSIVRDRLRDLIAALETYGNN